MSGVNQCMEMLATSTKRKAEELNSQRKMDQELIMPSLVNMNQETDRIFMKAWEIKQRCTDLEKEINRKKRKES